MKTFLLLCSIGCFLCFTANAQADFRSGFVVTLQNDTLSGFVAFQSNAGNTRTCKFKSSTKAQTITYSPSDILAYGFENGRWYESNQLTNLSNSQEQHFFQVLVQGKVSLFFYQDRFFLKKEDANNLTELSVTEIVNESDKLKKKVKVKTYLPVLYELIDGCSKYIITAEYVTNCELNIQSITIIVEKINECLGAASITYDAKQPWLKVNAGVLSGVNLSNLNYEVSEDDFESAFLGQSAFNTNGQFVVGLQLNLSSPRINERLSWQLELWYLKNSYEGYSELTINRTIQRNNIYINSNILKLPVLFSYSQPINNYKLNYRIGFSNNFNTNINTRRVTEEQLETTIYTRHSNYKAVEGLYLGICGGVGLSYKLNNELSINLETRYEYGKNTLSYYNDLARLNNTASNFSFLLGVIF